MTVADLLAALDAAPTEPVHLLLPDGDLVPSHYHLTEVGRVRKDFIDCGGTRRTTVGCVLQVWVAADTDHRLDAGKFARIVRMAGPLLGSAELPVEVEYEGAVMSQFPAAAAEQTPRGVLLHLGRKHTDCLAKEACAIPVAAGAAAGCCAVPGCC